MKYLICSIFDSAVGAYMAPFIQRAKGEAIRTFIGIASNPETLVAKRPADYSLFVLGEWDEVAGVVRQLEAKVCLGTALEFLSQDTPARLVKDA